MDQLLQEAPVVRVGGMRAKLQVLIGEHVPDAEDLKFLCGVSFDDEIEAHGISPGGKPKPPPLC